MSYTELLHYVNRTKWLKIDGKEYKKEIGIVYSIEQDLPIIFQISNLYVINGSTVVFKGHCHSTRYHPHFHFYSLNSLEEESYFMYDQLPLSTPLHIRLSRVMPTKHIVILPFKIDNYFV